jgi:glycyl-tRNA synthetase beta subunit
VNTQEAVRAVGGLTELRAFFRRRCRSAGAVEGGTCQVCDATLEFTLRFADMVDGVHLIATLAELEDGVARAALAHACARAEALLSARRDQFMAEVVGVGVSR